MIEKYSNSFKEWLILFPFLWVFAIQPWVHSGSKKLVVIAVIAVVISLFLFGQKLVIDNWRNSFWLKGVLCSIAFAVFSYQYHGFSSQELRAYFVGFVYILCFPTALMTNRRFALLLILSGISMFTISFWHIIVLDLDRMLQPTNPIPLSVAQGVVAVVCFGFITKVDSVGFKRWLGLAGAAACIGCFLAGSRGGSLSLIIVLATMVFYYIWKKKQMSKIVVLSTIGALSVFLVTTIILSQELISRTAAEVKLIENGEANTSIGIRLQLWELGGQMFLNRPILGYGTPPQSYYTEAFGTHPKVAVYARGHLHNNYIDKLARNGLIGFVLWMFLLLYPVYLFRDASSETKLLVFSVSLLYLVSCMTDSPFRNGGVAIAYLLLMGLFVRKKESANQ